jgi:hypothetical protein
VNGGLGTVTVLAPSVPLQRDEPAGIAVN